MTRDKDCQNSGFHGRSKIVLKSKSYEEKSAADSITYKTRHNFFVITFIRVGGISPPDQNV
jgi:hypothetical protein